MNRFCCLLLLVSCVLNFTGCTTRPPSAVQFMETYRRSMELKEKPDAYVDFGFSLLGSFPAIICQRDVSWKSVCNAENEYADQLPYDLSGQMTVLMDSHFLIGAELHYIDLNFFVGTAFEHFGVMGWVDAVGSVADKTPGIGLMIMEQFPIGDIVPAREQARTSRMITFGSFFCIPAISIMTIVNGMNVMSATSWVMNSEQSAGRNTNINSNALNVWIFFKIAADIILKNLIFVRARIVSIKINKQTIVFGLIAFT